MPGHFHLYFSHSSWSSESSADAPADMLLSEVSNAMLSECFIRPHNPKVCKMPGRTIGLDLRLDSVPILGFLKHEFGEKLYWHLVVLADEVCHLNTPFPAVHRVGALNPLILGCHRR